MGKKNMRKGYFAVFLLIWLITATALGRRMNVAAAADILTVTEEQSGENWNSGKQICIFDSVHYGGKVLAPGSVGTYRFFVKNQTKFTAICSLTFTEQNPSEVPIRYRLWKNGVYLSSDDKQRPNQALSSSQEEKQQRSDDSMWLDCSGLETAAGKQEMEPGECAEYTLEWKWVTTDHTKDTLLGIAARDGISYTLDINVTAEQESTEDIPRTGDELWNDFLINVVIAAVMLITAAIWLTVFLLVRHGNQPYSLGYKHRKRISRGTAVLTAAVFLTMASGLVIARFSTEADGSSTAEAAAFIIEAEETGEHNFHIDYHDGMERFYSVEYPFNVTNEADGKVCEVSVEYDVSLVIEVETGAKLPEGIEIQMDGQNVLCTHSYENENKCNVYTYTLENAGKFEAGEKAVQEHTAEIVIDSEKTVNSSWLKYIAGSVKIHAEQVD